MLVMMVDYCAYSYSSLSVAKEVVDPVDEEWRDVNVVEFLYHLVALNCVECGAEVDKED